jgi:hypothetical protein
MCPPCVSTFPANCSPASLKLFSHQQAARYQDEIQSVEPHIKDQMVKLGEAVACFHAAVQMRQYCKENNNVSGMKQWKLIEDALTCIGVSDFIQQEMERRKRIQEDEAREKAERRKRAAIELAEKEARENEAAAAAADAETESEVTVAMIKDKDGNNVPVDSVFQIAT